MNLKQLEAFVKVAQYKSFSGAAAAMYLTQPTVSAHVNALEREWGVRLFVRSTKTVELTQLGRQIYERAQKMISLQDELFECIRVQTQETEQTLRIATSTVPGQYLLPDIIAALRRTDEYVTFRMMETDSRGVVEMIRSGKADVGFCGAKWEEKDLTYEPVYTDKLVLIAPYAEPYLSRIRDKEPIMNWLSDTNFIMRESGSGTRREVERWLLQSGIPLSEVRAGMVIENPEMIKQLVKNGSGISVMSKLAVSDMVERREIASAAFGSVTQNGTVEATRKLYVVYSGDPTPLCRTLIDEAMAVCRRMQEESYL